MENEQAKPIFSPPASPVTLGAALQGQSVGPAGEEDEGLALGEIIAVLLDYRWLIAAICLFALLLGVVGFLPASRHIGPTVCFRWKKRVRASVH